MAELRDRNAEVERMRVVAASDLAQRSAFFASASHDFRQRVHAMKLLAQSGLEDGVPPALEVTPKADSRRSSMSLKRT
jgi:signal transduction histidine kinase